MTWLEIGLLSVAGALLALEVVALTLGQQTISVVLRRDGRIWLSAPAVWGLLPGHFWGPHVLGVLVWGQTAAFAFWGAVLLRDILNAIFWRRTIALGWAFGFFVVFVAIGAVLWAQG